MSSHAKASTAGSTQRQATGLGRLFRGAVATRASSFGRNGRGTSSGRLGVFGATFLAVAALLALSAATASATITHTPESFSPITGSGSGVTIDSPSGIAVDEASGNVFLSSNHELLILGSEGGAPAELAAPFSLSGFNYGSNTYVGLAFDNVASSPNFGTLYSYERTKEEIGAYVRNGTTEQYEHEPSLDIPVPEFNDPAGAGIDSEGDLYLGGYKGDFVTGFTYLVDKFDTSGTKIAEYDVGSCLHNGTPGQIAVDNAGDIFVQVPVGGVYKFPADGFGEIDPADCEPIVIGRTGGVAYDPASNHVYIVTTEDSTAEYPSSVLEYDATTLAKVSEFGGEDLGYRAERVALNLATQRIYVADFALDRVDVFGPAVIVPTTGAYAASEITGTKATLNGGVNPEGIEVTECFFEYGATTSYGHTAPCEGAIPTDEEAHPVSAKIGGLTPNGATYHYRLVAENENGPSKSADKTLVTASTVTTAAATDIEPTAATLHGFVRPEGDQYTECAFEIKAKASASFEEVVCEPEAGEIDPDFSEHAVSAQLAELQSNATYEVRLKATNSEATRYGDVLSFTTTGPPQISEIRAREATQGSVVLEAKINPRGFGTSYHFEWGPTASYGTSIPAGFESFIGSGETPVLVTAKISGLTAGTAYHYRVVANNTAEIASTTVSPDQTFETLNSCGLPEARCLELVSPRDPGPIFAPARAGGGELQFSAGETPGKFVYEAGFGLPDATRGAEVVYLGSRDSGGWSSTQYAPGISERNERNGGSRPSYFLGTSADLSCAVLASPQPLTAGPAGRLTIEAGGANLYRRNSDGSYTLLTPYPPEDFENVVGGLFLQYELIGMSRDCDRIVFATDYHYTGIPGAGEKRLYEWDEGTLRNVGWVPTEGGGEEVADATGGSPKGSDLFNAVSEDGSRVFFSAKRQTGNNPEEVGKTGVFARIDGTQTIDVSLSQTATPNVGFEIDSFHVDATFQGATPDGKRVFFVSNAGLTAETSEYEGTPEGWDLYEYDLESETLRDLSISHEAGGAQVGGRTAAADFGALVGLAADGSHVYFIARGRLVPGRGKSLAQNLVDDTFSLYEESAGSVHFVATVGGSTSEVQRLTLGRQARYTSRTSKDGRYLLFETGEKVTEYDGGGAPEAYLYDAAASRGSEAVVCLSCRQDGKPSVNAAEGSRVYPLASSTRSQQRSLVVREGRPLVFFLSPDGLAPGGEVGEWALYEWSHGQVFHIATERPNTSSPPNQGTLYFGGASADGTDLYFSDPAALNWENPEGRNAAWDARIAGGFPEPPKPAQPCDPTDEGSCQGSSSEAGSSPKAASKDLQGAGNVKEAAKGAGANSCARTARQAKRLSLRAKKLRQNARKLAQNGHGAKAGKLARKARRVARRAKATSKHAKRCRARRLSKANKRTDNHRRAGK